MRVQPILALAWAVLVGTSLPATADTLFTPFLGANMNGAISSPIGSLTGDASRTTFGGSLAVMGGGVFGIEADAGYTPRFFGTDVQVGGAAVSLARNSVITAMLNLTVGVPIEGGSGVGLRPYAVAGIGLIRQQLEAGSGLVDVTSHDFGYDVGGGAILFVGRHVGIRGDIRYFSTTGNNPFASLVELREGSFHFTRASVGLTLRY
jgi:hypothetical protein